MTGEKPILTTPVSARPRANLRGTGLRRRWTYAFLGALLGLGSPVGAALVRMVTRRASLEQVILEEVVPDWQLYLYLTVSTVLAFGIFGGIVGGMQDRLQRTSLTDALTGLPNRRHLMLLLEHELGRTERLPEDLSLLLLDVDGLKRINDTEGHAAGDRALRAVAEAMREVSRRSDLPARISGDEFGVIAIGTGPAEAVSLAERIRAMLARKAAGPRVSIGVVTLSRVGPQGAEAFLDAADEALYVAKTTGRDRVVEAGPRETESARPAGPPVPIRMGRTERSMKVREIMTRTPASCGPDAPLQEVARLMVEHDCGSIPVAQDGCLLGVITDRDIACRAVARGRNPLELKASDCMSTPGVSVSEDASVEECCELMEKHMIRRIPVLDAQGRLSGIVAQADIARRAGEGTIAEVVTEVSQPVGAPSRVQ